MQLGLTQFCFSVAPHRRHVPHSAVDGCLGSFSLFAVTVGAAVTILAAVCWGTHPRMSVMHTWE